MTYTCFDIEIADHVAHLRFKRPEHFNTMTVEFWREFPEAIRDIDDNAKARVIVISSTGRHFCAGMELSVFGNPAFQAAPPGAERGRAGHALREWVKTLQNAFNALDNARVPVLVGTQGACIGGAVDLISACDFRYATDDSFFCIQEINIGMTADVGTFPRLCHLIPQGWVRELAYTGRRLSAKTAKEIGLVNTLYPNHEALVDGLLEAAREIAQRSPLAVAGSKVMINYARDHSIDDALDYIATWQTGMLAGTDMQEAFTATAEKRDPVFDDLLPARRKV